jgi:restriction system protein
MSPSISYHVDVRHDGLNKFRRIKGKDPDVVQELAERQQAAWDEQWQKKQAAEQKKRSRETSAQAKQAKKDLAEEQTREAEADLDSLDRILEHTLTVDDQIDWDSLKHRDPFPEPKPPSPKLKSPKAEPDPKHEDFQPRLSLFDHLLPPLKKKKLVEARSRFDAAHTTWVAKKEEIEKANSKLLTKYDEQVAQWESGRSEFLSEQESHNARIDEHQAAYESLDPDSIAEYCELVLGQSQYPESFPTEFELEYKPDTKTLVVEYQLPPLEALPRTKAVKYVQSRDEFQESQISDSALNRAYDGVVYQIALRTVHELFEADQIDALDAVVFNGWVRSTDRATGNEANACIVSLQAGREEFLGINLGRVDPKTCFKSLKGVGSSKLHSLTPVAPLLHIDTKDSRFVSSYDVADTLDSATNIAAMDWEDFEHLIREVFEKEFAHGGAEVRVTQASRDGGVDAIVFDPDPIRGGKIVIQAKRYTNTVGVAAVRDLYGTVVNEGATKGILVTTSDYGPDAYAFARDKPLSLLSGANLLHLLEKHGHEAKIDIKEAKVLLADRE